jgi:hypothetical protein
MDDTLAAACPQSRASDEAARRLEEACDDDAWELVEELMGDTDCPNGCHVGPDGRCPHGWQSAALTAGVI